MGYTMGYYKEDCECASCVSAEKQASREHIRMLHNKNKPKRKKKPKTYGKNKRRK